MTPLGVEQSSVVIVTYSLYLDEDAFGRCADGFPRHRPIVIKDLGQLLL